MKKAILYILFIFVAFTAQAQYKSTKLKMAEGLLEEGKIYAAIQVYEDILKKDASNKYIIKTVAELYEKIYDYESAAAAWYELMELGAGEYPKAEFHFATLNKQLGKYELAIEHFEAFSKSYMGHDKSQLMKICKDEIKGCKLALESLPNADYSITQLPKQINSVYSDLAPTTHDNVLYFASIPSDSALTYTMTLDSGPTFQIFAAKYANETFESPALFIPEKLNTPYKHTSNGAFNEDGSDFYFTRCKENVNGKMICKIYLTEKSDTGWTMPIKLGTEVNDPNNDFSSTNPTVMKDKKGKNDVLVFASTMPGGSGGYDLWSVEIGSDKTLGKPVNLGTKINTVLDDVTPFYDFGKEQFYFSSNGHIGFGGFDVYTATVSKGRIKKVVHMDMPVNSSYDDWYYNSMNSEIAFVVSNRKGSRAIQGTTPLDDIYLIKKETKKFMVFNALVADSSKENIEGALFKVSFTGDTKNQPNTLKSGQSFQIIPNRTYTIIAQKNGFINQEIEFSTSYDTKSDTIQWTFELTPIDTTKEIVIPNIYFETDNSAITQDSKVELMKLVKLLNNNPSFKIEIGAHTDSVGNSDYNQKLSEKRAQQVVTFLVSKGIGLNRLTSVGYGSSKPIASNTSEDGRQKNRRVAFRIVAVINVEEDHETTH